MASLGFRLARQAFVAVLAAMAFVLPLSASGQAPSELERVIVVYKDGAAIPARAAVLRAGGRVVLDLSEVNALAASLPANRVGTLRRNPSIEAVEIDPLRYAMGSRGSPLVETLNGGGSEQLPYGLSLVQANQLAYNPSGSRKICIIDSGIDLTHDDLQLNLITGENLTSSGEWYTDERGHGTHVAGTIAAMGSNGVGVIGVVPDGQLPLHIIKVFDASGSARSSTIIKAVLRCAINRANVVNMSLGGGIPLQLEQRIYERLADRGILVIAAAGNAGDSTISYPAGYPSVISVAAVDSNGVRADFSQYNADVEIAGPGVGVLSTVPMGSGRAAAAMVSSTDYAVQPIEGTPVAAVTAPLADFGLGDAQSPGSMAGKVCLISRGVISFVDKVLNCQSSGGLGAIIYNNTAGELFGTLGGVSTAIPSVGATQVDGTIMQVQLGQSATVAVSATSYEYYNGTSMATPHVAGVAALVWSHYPNSCTGEKLRASLTRSALDLGLAGRDDEYGAGLVQAKAAFDRIGSLGCGN